MSGITPILDTLLHQVLGKRVDVPVARQTPEPVRPLSPAEAPPAVRSDSRLDPRSAPLPDLPAAAQRSRTPQAPVSPADPAGGSTRTHFSAAARTIADILARYPAPPSAVRPSAPLLAAADVEVPSVAQRLQSSLTQSGLFYESHLHGWYRGEVSGARLALEPQMRLFQPAISTKNVPTGAEARAMDRGESVRPAPVPLSEEASQVLHGILRHQLETLATPVLRWEGDVWSGIFMALMIQVPDDVARQPRSDDHAEAGDDDADCDQDAWRSDLTVDFAALGAVRVRLNLLGDDLRIDLSAASENTARRLRAGGERLRARLHGHGFDQVDVRVVADD